MRRPLRPSLLALFAGALLLSGAADLRANTIQIISPDFLIPLNGQGGTLTLFSDGSAPVTSGFNSLGSQQFVLGAGTNSNPTISTGWLDLNLVFSGPPLGQPMSAATIQFTIDDLDFNTDQVTTKITLTEMALITHANGGLLTTPINLASYLPGGVATVTDDQVLTLNPIDLIPPLGANDFPDPFTLSLRLSAEVVNKGGAVTLVNTPEALITDLNLTMTPVPEPTSLLLLGLGLAGVAIVRGRFR